MNRYIHLFVLYYLCLKLIPVFSEDQWMWHSESKWDKEWKSGAWSYMEDVPAERARIAVIGSVFIQQYGNLNASVLDVGCGEGAISDFLTPAQKNRYVGLDLSKEAIQLAKQRRGSPMKFVHAAAHLFRPTHKYDVIIFSDVLYYVEHEKVLRQYDIYLNPNGIIIISIFHLTEKLLYENIFQYARTVFDYLDELEIGGFTKKSKTSQREKTHFHIEVYRKKKQML
jgi:2-polyprenyl-3-methyl-5-hydroxy-6-metoxy-1,4-benzoquinol methylase